MRTLLSGLVAAALLAPGAHAAEPHVTDPAGDANAVNGQGVLPDDQPALTGVSSPGYDLVSVRFATLREKRRVIGFTTTVALVAAPGPASTYVVKMSTASCREIWLEYVVAETGDAEAELRHRCAAVGPTDFATYEPIQAVVSGTALTFTVTLASLPPGVGAGATLRDLRAESRTFVVAASAPLVDEAMSASTYRIGQ